MGVLETIAECNAVIINDCGFRRGDDKLSRLHDWHDLFYTLFMWSGGYTMARWRFGNNIDTLVLGILILPQKYTAKLYGEEITTTHLMPLPCDYDYAGGSDPNSVFFCLTITLTPKSFEYAQVRTNTS